ncbi:winged helix-turn-helix domain-containing protein [Desulforhopalus singaporensis]|uniref:Regulatory protein, arsR family n=1 Tax=Desulforhopalus singaporensis TaxID=91360 RepID=A0A1H0TYI2_9BACT|nr:winged helix-turn-helix domain-containing protein [Desulforhopalus singaporensis]SDP58999.1 regulatory protein, arsR family [Desulforhopalus singaporensis]
MSDEKKILQALADAQKPCGNKDLAEVTGLDKKVVSKHVAAMKKQGLVDSPVRCKYGITENGKKSLE